MRTVIVIPTYNESDNIQALVEEILALGDDLQIVIVDDNSPDGTGEIAERLARSRTTVHVIHRPAKLGLGTAYITGFRRGFALGADRIMTMDADFSHHPSYIPQMLHMSQDYDVVIGSRYVDGGGTRYWGLPRRLLSRTANACARVVLGLNVRDCTAGFRCYRREVLEAIDLDNIFSDGYSFLVEMIYKCQEQGFRIAEFPIIFEDRRHGHSKISRQEIFKAMYTLARLRWEQALRVPFPKLKRRKGESPWNM
jgi:glycosyltransferase involved in cell wall biosynthesis